MRGIVPGKRLYNVTAFDHGSIIWDDQVVSTARIGSVLRVMFRKIFGDPSYEQWHLDGSMGEAWDRHGYRKGKRVMVEQLNRDMTPIALLPPHRPLHDPVTYDDLAHGLMSGILPDPRSSALSAGNSGGAS